MIAVQTMALGKSYDGTTHALHDLRIEVPEGEIFALLGPNGSGKTTTIRLLNGVLTPTSGEARVFGLEPLAHVTRLHAMSGVMTETAQPYETMTAVENLEFFGGMHGLSPGDCREQADRWLSFFDLRDARDRPVKTFSTGMKKRLLLAIAILHRPRILFLDEPTSGLDPEAARTVNHLIKRLSAEEKVTVFLCTHQLRYAEDICTLYGFMSNGRLIGFGSFPDLLAQQQGTLSLLLRTSSVPDSLASFRLPSGWLKFPIDHDEAAAERIATLTGAGIKVYEARQEHMSLEDLYFAFQKQPGTGPRTEAPHAA